MSRSVSLLLLFAAIGPAAAQNVAQPSLDALTAEVRQLRLAVERTNNAMTQSYIMLHRFDAQEGKVARISGELEGVKMQIEGLPEQVRQLKAQIDQFESMGEKSYGSGNPPNTMPNAIPIPALEGLKQSLKTQMEQSAAREQQLRAREAELSSQLRVEQGVLDALLAKLDALEKSLEAPPQR